MNWDRIEGNWKQFIGHARQQWGRITEDELDIIAGRRDTLAGQIQEVYGITKDEVETQLVNWQKGLLEISKSTDATVRPGAK